MITKNSEIHNADRLIYAIIKCAVDDYKTELRGEGKIPGQGALCKQLYRKLL